MSPPDRLFSLIAFNFHALSYNTPVGLLSVDKCTYDLWMHRSLTRIDLKFHIVMRLQTYQPEGAYTF